MTATCRIWSWRGRQPATNHCQGIAGYLFPMKSETAFNTAPRRSLSINRIIRPASWNPHQSITFPVASPLQAAAATALNLPSTYYESLQAMYQAKRDMMLDVLRQANFNVLKPDGGYFIMVDWRGVAPAHVQNDVQFAQWL